MQNDGKTAKIQLLIMKLGVYHMNRIKELRLENNYTLQYVADAVGLSNGTIANYENEKREPKLETWKKLANFFGVSVGYLQGLTNYRKTFFEIDYNGKTAEPRFDENGNLTPEFKEHLNKVGATYTKNISKDLSTRLREILITEDYESYERIEEIDNNLSDISDRLLISRLLDGVSDSVGVILLTEHGIKKHRKELKEISAKLDKLNLELLKLAKENLNDLPNDNYNNDK